MLIKGDNSEYYKITHNEHELRDVVYQNPQNALNELTLHLNQTIYSSFDDSFGQNNSRKATVYKQ